MYVIKHETCEINEITHMLRGTLYGLQFVQSYLLEVHAFANEMLINCTSADVIDNLSNKLILS